MEEYLILIIFHLLGDFYLQTTKITQCKDCSKINEEYLFIHSSIYIIPFLILYFLMTNVYATTTICVLFVTHILIDGVSCYFDKKYKQTVIFFVNQVLHIGIICFLPRFITFNCHIVECNYIAFKIVFVALMLITPCSIMISKIFQDIYPQSIEMGVFDIGSIIGIMERILTFIFACFESFSAIAIIITVKTWARTNDLKEPEFRNKYLLGTLTSLVLALITFVIYQAI